MDDNDDGYGDDDQHDDDAHNPKVSDDDALAVASRNTMRRSHCASVMLGL